MVGSPETEAIPETKTNTMTVLNIPHLSIMYAKRFPIWMSRENSVQVRLCVEMWSIGNVKRSCMRARPRSRLDRQLPCEIKACGLLPVGVGLPPICDHSSVVACKKRGQALSVNWASQCSCLPLPLLHSKRATLHYAQWEGDPCFWLCQRWVFNMPIAYNIAPLRLTLRS